MTTMNYNYYACNTEGWVTQDIQIYPGRVVLKQKSTEINI
jgi:hypothetical protein